MGSMPTSRSTSAERSWISSRDFVPCATIVSRNCAPMLVTGFSAFIALCMTTERSFQRTAASCLSVIVTRLWPANCTEPAVISAGGLSSRAMANSMVDFPHADSPTTPRNSPGPTSRSTSSTARTAPADVAYSTVRPRTSRMLALGTGPPHRAQGRVADLVEGVVDERERYAEQGDAQPGRDRPQWHAGLQRLLVLRPVEHRAPAGRVRVAEAEELESGRGQDGVERRAEEVRDDQRRHGGQHLDDDDVAAPLAPHPGRFQEFAVAEGQRLGPHLIGTVRPPGDHQDDQHDQQRALPGIRGQDDD